MQFLFSDQVLDTDRRELRRGRDRVSIEPQVFDLLVYLVENRDRVVSKDDLIAAIWDGRIVSESTLTSRINAARKAVGDSGRDQAVDPHHCAQGLSLRRRLAIAAPARSALKFAHPAADAGEHRARYRRRSTGPPSRCCPSPT